MTPKLMYIHIKIGVSLLIILAAIACEPFAEEGYRVDYELSDAVIKVEPVAYEMGAASETISYEITCESSQNIKSLIVQSTNNGANGSGYDVSDTMYDDPFADHTYGTMKKNISKFKVKYNFIVPSDISKSLITFTLIDETGKVSVQRTIKVVQGIAKYSAKQLYAKDNQNFDALALSDGTVYKDIKLNYSVFSELSKSVQEKIDLIFYYDTNTRKAVIASPKSDMLGLTLSIENNTLLKKLSMTDEVFDSLTTASLVENLASDSIQYKGFSQIEDIRIGDKIGFATDINSIESLKIGVLRVNSLHPTIIDHYKGTAYVMECDVVTQLKK